MECPLISVIVPVYNVEKYLDRCIESIVNQTYKNLEIILIDDGSPDNCPQMCDDWEKKDSRIIVIHLENGGAGKARNAGLKICTGDYISFVDSDDCIHERFHETLLSYFDDDTDIVECDYLSFGEDVPDFESQTIPEINKYDTETALKQHISDKLFKQVIWNKLYRRQIVEDIEFPEGKLIDDEFWTYKAIGKTRFLKHCSIILYAYRQQDASVMHKKYSILRLQSIEAKYQRYEYIRREFPSLKSMAKISFIEDCIYQGQMVKKHCTDSEKEEAFSIIKHYLNLVELEKCDYDEMKTTHKLWARLSRVSVQFVCGVKNLLNIGL